MNFILDTLFPKFCLGCKKEGNYLCEDCRTLLDINEFNHCLCDRPTTLPYRQKAGKCGRCHSKSLSGLYFALPYKESKITKKLIHQFKYKPYLKDLAETLAGILIEHFVLAANNTEEIWQNSVLVPVPIHIKKLRERGYNQSEELAKELSKVLKIPVATNVLTKIKHTEPQMKLSKAEREKNLFGAFSICHPRESGDPDLVRSDLTKFSKIFLVDDVYTTGSTMQECAKTLKESGTKSVWGICIAREG